MKAFGLLNLVYIKKDLLLRLTIMEKYLYLKYFCFKKLIIVFFFKINEKENHKKNLNRLYFAIKEEVVIRKVLITKNMNYILAISDTGFFFYSKKYHFLKKGYLYYEKLNPDKLRFIN